MMVPAQSQRTGHQQKGFLTVHYLRPDWCGDLLVFYWSVISFPGDSVVKNLPADGGDMGGADLLEQETAFYSSVLAWKIPWTEESGRLQSMGSQTVGRSSASKHPRITVLQGCVNFCCAT